MPAVGDPARERARGVLALAILSNTTAALPAFLLGALAVLVRDDLRFGEGELGLAVAIFFACSALVAIPGGRLTERIGARAAIALAAVCSAMSLAGVALLAGAWTDLAVFLAIGGVGDGLSQPATNLSLARAVPARRQGLAFGVKQASIPLATLTAGLAVPVIGVTLGWRVAYGLAAFATVPVVALLAARRLRPHERVPRTPRRSPSSQRGVEGSVVWLAAAGGCAAAAATAMAAFFVEAAVARGSAPTVAGLWLMYGSICGIGGRVLWGWVADRRADADDVALAGALFLGGAVGFVFLAAVPGAVGLLVGAALAFGAGWAWPGVLILSIVRRNPTAPAQSTGIAQAGFLSGAVIGPIVFGVLIERFSHTMAWLIGAGVLAVAAVLAFGVARRLPTAGWTAMAARTGGTA